MTKAQTAFKKSKKKSVGYYKNRLWPYVSVYIRRRDADENGYVECVTCGRWKEWRAGDAGHFIDGRRNAIVYDERNIHFQCKPCNGSFINQAIEPKEVKNRYEEYMVKRYGQEVVDELKEKNKEIKNWSIPELQALIEIYKSKVAEINK